MKRGAFVFPALIAGYGAYVMWNALARMAYYDAQRGAPGPGFLPFWLALGMIALGSALAWRALRAPTAPSTTIDPAERARTLRVFVALVAAIVLFAPLGFVVTIALFVACVGHALGLRRWRALVPAALGSALGLYALFTWLGVALPRGVLAF